mmetsp:Transcript_16183/g.30041  ORF Transcript_16183/g.30041 Transcript_16183/m.30041 type:complete len:106 (-) Transcript_16183:1161-1478(-)
MSKMSIEPDFAVPFYISHSAGVCYSINICMSQEMSCLRRACLRKWSFERQFDTMWNSLDNIGRKTPFAVSFPRTAAFNSSPSAALLTGSAKREEANLLNSSSMTS